MLTVEEVIHSFNASVTERYDLALPEFSFENEKEGVVVNASDNVATEYKDDITGNEWPMPASFSYRVTITRTVTLDALSDAMHDAVVKFCAEHRYMVNCTNQGNGWWGASIVVPRTSPWVVHNG